MPIYEYQCGKCGVFEVTQKITDAPLRRCPKCKGKASKLISSTSFQLKGSGWYATDYASKGKPGAKSESSDSTSESKDSPSKKDPETKGSGAESAKGKSSSSKEPAASAA